MKTINAMLQAQGYVLVGGKSDKDYEKLYHKYKNKYLKLKQLISN